MNFNFNKSNKSTIDLNNKENNTEKKEKLEDLEDNEFKKIKDSVFIDYNKNIEFLSEEKKYQNNYLQFNNLDSLLEKHSLSTEK